MCNWCFLYRDSFFFSCVPCSLSFSLRFLRRSTSAAAACFAFVGHARPRALQRCNSRLAPQVAAHCFLTSSSLPPGPNSDSNFRAKGEWKREGKEEKKETTQCSFPRFFYFFCFYFHGFCGVPALLGFRGSASAFPLAPYNFVLRNQAPAPCVDMTRLASSSIPFSSSHPFLEKQRAPRTLSTQRVAALVSFLAFASVLFPLKASA